MRMAKGMSCRNIATARAITTISKNNDFKMTLENFMRLTVLLRRLNFLARNRAIRNSRAWMTANVRHEIFLNSKSSKRKYKTTNIERLKKPKIICHEAFSSPEIFCKSPRIVFTRMNYKHFAQGELLNSHMA